MNQYVSEGLDILKLVTDRSEALLVGALTFSVVFIIAYAIGQIARGFTRRYFLSRLAKKEIATFLSDLLFYIFLIIGVTVGLSTIGVNMTAVVASLGLGGFALGFALRDTIGNFVSGLMILLTKTFESGDWIKVSGFDGTVHSINLRHTVITKDGDGGTEKILVPNSIIFSSITVVRKKSGKEKPAS